MMLSFFQLWQRVYVTYRGDSDYHKTRVLIFFLISLVISYFESGAVDKTLEIMSVTISVLTGFTFTALLSGHGTSTADLPPSKDETDRQNITTLEQLEINFRARAKLLIVFSVVLLISMVTLSTQVNVKASVEWLSKSIFKRYDQNIFDLYYAYPFFIWEIGSFILRFLTFFIFFEGLYTFYRLSETVISALDIRRDYLAAHRK